MNCIKIFPRTEFDHRCPYCDAPVREGECFISGLWIMGRFVCGGCRTSYYHDLPYSLGVVAPNSIAEDGGRADGGKDWYREMLRRQYTGRLDKAVSLEVVRHARGDTILVNTLYPWFGDAVNLLLRINRLKGGLPVTVLVNERLRWLVPDWVQGGDRQP